jgi:HK97 family phage major capsid protein
MDENAQPTPDQISDEETQLRGTSALLTMVEGIRKKAQDETHAELAEALQNLDQPNRADVPDLTPRSAGQVRVTDPQEYNPVYRQLSDDERKWRSPESDHWVGEWARGLYHNDQARMLLANAKIDELYPRAERVMNVGTAGGTGAVATGSGGELAPRPLEAAIMINRDRVAKARRFMMIYNMTAKEHNIPTAASMTAAMVNESTGAAVSEPAIAQVPLIAQVGGVQARFTRELLEDSATNLTTVLSVRGGAALGVLEDSEVFDPNNGTGTAPHITALSGTTYSCGTTGAFDYSDALAMYHTLGQAYRDNAVWFAASNVLQLLGNVRDGQGRPMYLGMTDVPGPITDDPTAVGTLFRRPIYEVAMTDGYIWFGDPRACYAMGNRRGITVEFSRDALFTSRQVVAMITERFAGNNTDTAAAQICSGVTSATSA